MFNFVAPIRMKLSQVVVFGLLTAKRFDAVRGDCVPAWAQCSVDDDQAVSCCAGSFCTKLNDYYSQCLPDDATDDGADGWTHPPTRAPTPAPSAPSLAPSSMPWIDDEDGESPYSCGATINGTLDKRASFSSLYEEYLDWHESYVVEAGPNGTDFCVEQVGQGQLCVSEGLGYGMLLSAYFEDQNTFDVR